MSDFSKAVLSEISSWIDNSPAYAGRDPELVLSRRLLKVSAEAGEVADAYSGMVGENPRKGVHATRDDLLRELLDTATAALGVVEHITGNQGAALDLLDRHIITVGERAGVIGTPGAF